jgi:hypothetical protein
MNESAFRAHMQAAKAIGGDYGRGYQRGLRRHHHGASFGTAEEHKRWMRAAEEPHRAELGRGYRDGHAGRAPSPGGAAEETETTTLNVRGIATVAAHRIKRASDARGLTIGQYLARLVNLHDAIRARADHGGTDGQGDPALLAELTTLGLETIMA